MSKEDEEQLLAFLRSTCEIEIIESFAPTKEGLLVDRFNEEFLGHTHYRVWNKSFDWVPSYGTVGERAQNKDHIGWHFVSNCGRAPLLEISRSFPDLSCPGRLYWARNFSASNGLLYDSEEFNLWIDKIWRWVRKNGKKLNDFPYQPYALPAALEKIA